MTATLTACQSCGAELTGGADTFGGVGESLCFGCFTSPGPDGEPMLLPRPSFLVDLIGKLRYQLREAAREEEAAHAAAFELEGRIAAIEVELNGGRRCREKERDADEE